MSRRRVGLLIDRRKRFIFWLLQTRRRRDVVLGGRAAHRAEREAQEERGPPLPYGLAPRVDGQQQQQLLRVAALHRHQE